MGRAQIIGWISEARFEPYLDAADHDEAHALALYEWHAQLSSACFEVIHHFEVLLRNAVDGVLGSGQPDEPVRATWLMDPNILIPEALKQVIIAIDRLEKGKAVTRGRVVAAVSFGFWSALFTKQYEELWRHRLRHAFVEGGLQRKDITARIKRIQRFRNRIAHHDSLFGQPVAELHEDMLLIASWIAPEARDWLTRLSRVPDLLAERPSAHRDTVIETME